MIDIILRFIGIMIIVFVIEYKRKQTLIDLSKQKGWGIILIITLTTLLIEYK